MYVFICIFEKKLLTLQYNRNISPTASRQAAHYDKEFYFLPYNNT